MASDQAVARFVQITATVSETTQRPAVFALDEAGHVWRYWGEQGWMRLSDKRDPRVWA